MEVYLPDLRINDSQFIKWSFLIVYIEYIFNNIIHAYLLYAGYYFIFIVPFNNI